MLEMRPSVGRSPAKSTSNTCADSIENESQQRKANQHAVQNAVPTKQDPVSRPGPHRLPETPKEKTLLGTVTSPVPPAPSGASAPSAPSAQRRQASTQPASLTDSQANGETISLSCPKCSDVFPVLRIPGIIAGCPRCGQNLQIPESAFQDQFSHASAHERPVAPRPRQRRGLKILVCIILLLVVSSSIAGTLWFFLWNRSPLHPYRTAIPDDAVTVFHGDFSALRADPAFEEEKVALDKALQQHFVDLKVEPRSASLVSHFACGMKLGETLQVFTFDRPVRFGDGTRWRYRKVTDEKEIVFFESRFGGQMYWAVDGQGRLIGGPVNVVTAALERERANRSTAAYDKLAKWVKDIPVGALAWG